MHRTSLGITLMLAALAGTACHRTRPVALNDALASPSVYVTLDDKSTFLLYTPKVYGTNLTGWIDGKYTEYPTSRVKQVEVRESDRAATAALVGLGVAGAATIAYLITRGGPSDDTPSDCELNSTLPGCE